MTSVATQLAALTGLAQRMEEVVPGALRALDEYLSELDGMAHGGDDAVVSTSLGSSTVERAAMQLATGPYARDRDEIVDGIRNVAASLHHLLRVADKYVVKAEHKRCSHGGREGYLEWHDAMCENYSARPSGGPCIQCGDREQDWRDERGLGRRSLERDASGRFARGAA